MSKPSPTETTGEGAGAAAGAPDEEGRAAAAPRTPEPDDRIRYGDQSVHEAFQRKVAELLANADISEEERQQFLIAMSCPCCGGGGISFSLKIRDPGSTPSF